MRRALTSAATVLLGGVLTTACIGDRPSLKSLKSSADARIRRGAPERKQDDTTAALLAAPLTADSATRVALLNNRRVLAAYEKLGVAHGELEHAIRVPNPSVDLALRYRAGSDKPEIDLFAGIGLTELALIGIRESAASSALEAERLEVVGFIVDLAYDVREALIEYLAAEQTLELERTVLAATQASSDAASRLHEAGNLNDLELANERALSTESRVAARRADTLCSAARARLSALMGLGTGTAWSTGARLAEPPPNEISVLDLERRAVEQNLDLLVARQRAKALDQHVTVARVEGVMPELRIGVSAEHDDTGWGVGPAFGVEVPLFYQGQGIVDAATAELQGAAHLSAQLTLELRHAAQEAGAKLLAARESALEYRDVLLPLRKRVLDETELQYNAMAIGVFQLLLAKRDTIAAARTYVELLRDYWIARAHVERLEAGRLRVER